MDRQKGPTTEEILDFTEEIQPERKAEAVDRGGEAFHESLTEYAETMSKIQELKTQIEEKSLSIEAVNKEIDLLENSIVELENKSLRKILLYKKHKAELEAVRGRINSLQSTLEATHEDLRTSSQLLAELNEVLRGIHVLKGVEESVDSFYLEQAEALEADREMRSVQNISKKNNVFFAHGIMAKTRFSPKSNSALQMGTDALTELGIITTLKPEISCSTVFPGDTRKNLWADSGVIVKGGSVRYANQGDGATVANNFLERTSLKSKIAKNEGDIQDAISLREYNQYNEFTVREPELAGYFVTVDDENTEMPINPLLSLFLPYLILPDNV